MNERPTPETDASRGYALSSHYGRLEGSYLQMDKAGPFVHAEVARKLERERDEANEELHKQLVQFDQLFDEAEKIRIERDEAREALREWQTLRLWGAEPQHIHDFIKGQQTRIHESQEIEKTCEQLERERDMAEDERIDLAKQLRSEKERHAKCQNERDEAREVLKRIAHASMSARHKEEDYVEWEKAVESLQGICEEKNFINE